MIKAQKHSKDIIKIIHVTSVVQPSFYEATRIPFVRKENKNKDFIQQFVSSASSYRAILESITYINNVCNVCTRDMLFTLFTLWSNTLDMLFTYVILSKFAL